MFSKMLKTWVLTLSYWVFPLSFEFLSPWVIFKMSKGKACFKHQFCYHQILLSIFWKERLLFYWWHISYPSSKMKTSPKYPSLSLIMKVVMLLSRHGPFGASMDCHVIDSRFLHYFLVTFNAKKKWRKKHLQSKPMEFFVI